MGLSTEQVQAFGFIELGPACMLCHMQSCVVLYAAGHSYVCKWLEPAGRWPMAGGLYHMI